MVRDNVRYQRSKLLTREENIQASVIIPTYNRAESLRVTLNALDRSNFEPTRFEVIVVDDGSTDETRQISRNRFTFPFQYIWQSNQGDAIARNLGARLSRGTYLLFIDDDISVHENFLRNSVRELKVLDRTILNGTLIEAYHIGEPDRESESNNGSDRTQASAVEIPFMECRSGLLMLKQSDFISIGLMQPLWVGGWSMWSDVDFSYRAYLQGYSFKRSTRSIGYHRDLGISDMQSYYRRMYEVSRAAVLLFQKHPGLFPHIPMFRDKSPLDWTGDSAALILRKVARKIASQWISIRLLKSILNNKLIDQNLPFLKIPFERWILGGYIYNGYRVGLFEHNQEDLGSDQAK